jgi:hypothetical protein
MLFEEGCDVVVADVGPDGIPLHEAAGFLSWIASRFRAPAVAMAVAAEALPLTAATKAGFTVVLDRLPEAAVIAEVVRGLVADARAGAIRTETRRER